MRSVFRGVIVGLVALLLADALVARLGIAGGLWPRLAGPAAWLASRAAGITAYVALTLDVALGLFVSGGLADRWIPRARGLVAHRWLSGAALAIVAGHALVLLLDGFAGLDLLDLAVPFTARRLAVPVALGVLAGYTALIVRRSFQWRPRIGARAWKRLHALSFVAFALATAHGLAAGSDVERPWVRALYLGAVALVVGLSTPRALDAAQRSLARRPAGA